MGPTFFKFFLYYYLEDAAENVSLKDIRRFLSGEEFHCEILPIC